MDVGVIELLDSDEEEVEPAHLPHPPNPLHISPHKFPDASDGIKSDCGSVDDSSFDSVDALLDVTPAFRRKRRCSGIPANPSNRPARAVDRPETDTAAPQIPIAPPPISLASSSSDDLCVVGDGAFNGSGTATAGTDGVNFVDISDDDDSDDEGCDVNGTASVTAGNFVGIHVPVPGDAAEEESFGNVDDAHFTDACKKPENDDWENYQDGEKKAIEDASAIAVVAPGKSTVPDSGDNIIDISDDDDWIGEAAFPFSAGTVRPSADPTAVAVQSLPFPKKNPFAVHVGPHLRRPVALGSAADDLFSPAGRTPPRRPLSGSSGPSPPPPCSAPFLSPVARPSPRIRPPGISPTAGSALVGSLVPAPSPPVLNAIGGRLYPCLRRHFVHALISHGEASRHAAYRRPVFDSALRAATVLAVWEHPVRSPYSLKSIKGVGRDLLEVCQESCKHVKHPSRPPYFPSPGKLCSVTEAVLVALYEYKLEKHETDYCTMEELIFRLNSKIDHPHCRRLDRPVSYYLDKNTMDPGWGQVKKLCHENVSANTPPLIKERSRKGLSKSGTVYEILEAGEAVAERLLREVDDAVPTLGPLRQLAATHVDESYGDVTLCVDLREGGGGSKGLHSMCDLLDGHGVPYVVREIRVADYLFFVGNKLAPVMVERKSVEDVASSMADGRWGRQQKNMRIAQYLLGGRDRKCQMSYLIEGVVSKQKVHGGNVGRRSWGKSEEDVNNAISIENLGKLGFSKMESRSHRESMMILSRIARDVNWKVKNGSIDLKYTYDELIQDSRVCDASKGNPPTDKKHQNPWAPVVTNIEKRTAAERRKKEGIKFVPEQVDAEENDDAETIRRKEQFAKMPLEKLKKLCRERAELQSGPKTDLISRLLKPRKPEVIISRIRKKQYVPKVPSANAALMVAMYLNTFPGGEGLLKDKLMTLAEETGVSSDPMDGDGGFYDGWSGVKKLQEGDPPLVSVQKRKYSLTTNPPGSSGRDVAKALHRIAHRERICQCGLDVDT